MREILFRGKRIDNGEWVEGYIGKYFDGFKTETCISRPTRETIAGSLCYDVDPITVGQFTGLTDKNVKKIFEGDILQFERRRLVVWWNGEAFQWQAKTVAGYDLIPFGIQGGADWTNIDLGWIYSEILTLGKMTTEVIGNIHDNSELLEGNWDE